MDVKEKRKQYYLNNKDKLLTYSKQYYYENKEERQKYNKTPPHWRGAAIEPILRLCFITWPIFLFLLIF